MKHSSATTDPWDPGLYSKEKNSLKQKLLDKCSESLGILSAGRRLANGHPIRAELVSVKGKAVGQFVCSSEERQCWQEQSIAALC